jgi:hypothetical protein
MNFKITGWVAMLATLYLNTSNAQQESPWVFSTGLSFYNIFNENAPRTNSSLEFSQGFNMCPTLELAFRVKDNQLIRFKAETGFIMSLGVLAGNYWLDSQRNLWQLSYAHPLKNGKEYLIVGFSAYDLKAQNLYSFLFGDDRIIDQAGPSIGIGVNMAGGYNFELSNDMVWDFVEMNHYFLIGHLKARLTKNLIGSYKPSARNKEPGKWGVYVKFGAQLAYNHNHYYYAYMPYQQTHFFGEFDFTHKKTGLTAFWRRSIWVDLEPRERSAVSEYIITNNLGAFYTPTSSKNHFGLSYFNANESLMRQLLFETDSILKLGIYNMRGFSMHYERQLSGPLFFSSQIDFNLTKYSFMGQWYEFVRPRVGLAFRL